MGETSENLNRKLYSASELRGVVRTMKAISASNIGQYEASVTALKDYYRTVQLGLAACLRQEELRGLLHTSQPPTTEAHLIVFGSDQGLVGQFNTQVADYAYEQTQSWKEHLTLWAVGERVYYQLQDKEWNPKAPFAVPNAVQGIVPLVSQLLQEILKVSEKQPVSLYLFYHQPSTEGLSQPVMQRLLPLDKEWMKDFAQQAWPGNKLPQVVGEVKQSFKSFVDEFLFVSLFKACAESMQSENANRLASMQRAEKNIEELVDQLKQESQMLRQNSIDEELFDVIAGFEAMQKK